MHVELTDAQCEELRELVEAALSELATEIHRATDHAFREKLRARRAVLEQVRDQLQAARQQSVKRLVVSGPQRWREPLAVFAEQAQRPYCVWLDTATAERGRFSIIASQPAVVIRYRLGEGDVFELLNRALSERAVAEPREFPVGAAIGYFGYDLKNCLEKLPARAVADLGLPDCWFGLYDELSVFDHAARQVYRVHPPDPAPPNVANSCNNCCTKLQQSALRSNFTREAYLAAIARAKEYIAAGDIYQVNLAQRFQCDVAAAPREVYQALRKANPAPYCAYLDIGEAQILSSSPECFLRLRGRQVITRPIKGTAPRASDPAALLRSAKDNAELLMITDLERNDLGRVCEFGSVQVPELVRVETYATVHHLVATVTGRLRPEVSHVDCVRACFPGGSITGAPKIRAMEIIDELEPHARGVYCGAIGYFGYNGVSEFNIAIRTVVQQGSRLTFHAGGGIVADSDPAAEYAETLAKAQGIFNAIEQLRVR